MNNSDNKKYKVATNSILLAFVQCLTIVTGILQTMILSRELSETEYGTFSQGLLIVNFLVPFLLLGLANAITYFSGQKEIDARQYINTIVSLVVFLGIIGASGILLLAVPIQRYFGNEALASIIPLVAFLPLLLNLITVYQTLFVAEDMAKSVAIRNAIVAVLQIGIVAVSVFFFDNIHLIFCLLLIMDSAQVCVFAFVFSRRRFLVQLCLPRKEICGAVFKYAIPLALSTAVGTLSIYMDKLLIGRMMSVENFALYTNMAKELPFAFVVSSFTTVIMPKFIKMHADGKDESLRFYWGKYLELGMCITWILCGAAIFSGKDLLLFLFSEKYVRGLPIFIVYLSVELCRFSYFGIILSTFGKTKLIMLSSLLSLLCNFVLNIVLYIFLGMIGPAIASLVSIFTMQMLQVHFSCKLLKCKIKDIFDFRLMLCLAMELSVLGYGVNIVVNALIPNSFIRLIISVGIIVCAVGGLNYKRVARLIKEINLI